MLKKYFMGHGDILTNLLYNAVRAIFCYFFQNGFLKFFISKHSVNLEIDMTQKKWTREEMILAFNLYFKLPFGKYHHGNPEVIRLAKLIERTPSSIAMRLSNYASLDPFHQARGIKGLVGGQRQCQPIWDEFSSNREDLIFESERIRAKKEGIPIEIKFNEFSGFQKIGENNISAVKTRVNQWFFRQMILTIYSNRCAICGLNIPELLIASHIIPWSVNVKERLNPQNGLCLSPLYDLAFEKGFIGIDEKYRVIISNELKSSIKKHNYDLFFKPWEGQSINLPERYYPNQEFLQEHLRSRLIR
jgi:putative restriction endonuclease